MRINLLVVLISTIICILACKKDNDSTDPDSVDQQSLVENALYNSSIIPGVNNVLVERNLTHNSINELYMKLAFEGDTLLYFGKIDANGKLDYIHTTVSSRKDNSELFFTEIYPNSGKIRRYLVVDGVKDNLVIETTLYGENNLVNQLLDYDWENNTSKVLQDDLFIDGKLTESYSSARTTKFNEEPGILCGNDYSYFLQQNWCMESISESTFGKWISSALGLDEHKNEIEDGYEYQRKILNMPEEDINKLKQDAVDLNKDKEIQRYKEEFIRAGAEDKPPVSVELIPNLQSSKLHFVEGENSSKIELILDIKPKTFEVTKGLRIFVSVNIVDPETGKEILSTMEANKFNEKTISILLNPVESNLLRSFKKVEIRYCQSYLKWSSYQTAIATFEWEEPVLLFEDYSLLPNIVNFTYGEVKYFKLVKKSHSALTSFNAGEVAYKFVSDNSITNSDIKVRIEPQVDKFGIVLMASNLSLTSLTRDAKFDLYYKDQFVTRIYAKVTLNYYKITIIDGNDQSGSAGQPLQKKLQVKVLDPTDHPASNVQVNWKVNGGGGLNSTRTLSNAQGLSEVSWTLGSFGDQEVEASIVSEGGSVISPPIIFKATLNQGYIIEALSGNNQIGSPNTGLRDPLIVLVSNSSGVGQKNVKLEWKVITGNGSLKSAETITNEVGFASAFWTLDAEPYRQQKVQVSIVGDPESKAVFNTTRSVGEFDDYTQFGINTFDIPFPNPIRVVLGPKGKSESYIGVKVRCVISGGANNNGSDEVLTDNKGVALFPWKRTTGGSTVVTVYRDKVKVGAFTNTIP